MPSILTSISYNEAKSLMNAAIASAAKHNVPGAIAIVDHGGHIILLERLQGTMYAAANIASGKAATAVAFQRPTKVIEDSVLRGRTPMLVLNNTTTHSYIPLKGGYPILFDNQIVGGIAVAGTMDADMDEVVVLEALDSFG